ncbi:molybdenum cofactor guanylyltransferase [Pseudalkalibacillus berkeleyi]|uniref:Probable molybdenum cofactor guanylyltransferase n=1 Tax=Pseudalkalibacillus berkeleyi TaxID=1069813 RepID=A0ABS9H1F2_9BACL|nr:molybdenum cofactor guanylyltransferase [Pseudalkalibacillus berkeleyi]MCF6137911.1 molybdenum cofactor guanylyltransferase [Pseudalkalibacillus berkeleyi]
MNLNKVGIILAGGESRRYGTPKALEKLNGIPFYLRAVDVLRPLVERIVIVAHPSIENQLNELDDQIDVITDVVEYKGMGPLAGIYSGIKYLPAADYFVLASDMPIMRSSVFQQQYAVKKMLTSDCTIIPCVDGRIQPLAAIYSASITELIPKILKSDKRRLTDLLQQTNCAYLHYTSEERMSCFKNVNTPGDYIELTR